MRDKFKTGAIILIVSFLGVKESQAYSQEELNKYLDAMVVYAESVEKEFDEIRKNTRNDTELHIVERTENSMLVEIRIPTKEPVLREDRVEQKRTDPIIRKVRIMAGGNYKLVYDNGFFIEPILNIGFSMGSQNRKIQPNISLEIVNWGNEYLRLASGVLFGTERYGPIVTVGPARYLSNIRFVAGYTRGFKGPENNNIEVGISSSIYMK